MDSQRNAFERQQGRMQRESKSGNFGRINVYLSNDSNKTEITGTDCTGIFRVAKQRCKPKS